MIICRNEEPEAFASRFECTVAENCKFLKRCDSERTFLELFAEFVGRSALKRRKLRQHSEVRKSLEALNAMCLSSTITLISTSKLQIRTVLIVQTSLLPEKGFGSSSRYINTHPETSAYCPIKLTPSHEINFKGNLQINCDNLRSFIYGSSICMKCGLEMYS